MRVMGAEEVARREDDRPEMSLIRQSDLGRNQVWELRAGRGSWCGDRGGLRHGAGWGGR